MTLSTTGSGSGGVGPAGSYTADVMVPLAAVATPGSIFAGWSGHPDCADGSVTMSGPRDCVATFQLSSDPPPPPPTTTHQLTVLKTGSGSGTAAPAGTYPAGTVVTLTATPASGSIFGGWSGDADCIDGSVTMSRPLVCIAMFTVTSSPPPTPPPDGPVVSLPLKTWIARQAPPLDQGPWPFDGETKHLRLAHNPDDGRIYFGGGDLTSVSGGTSQNSIWSYDVRTDDWRLEWPASGPPYCGPAGTVQANTPDEVTWVWDSTRHTFWLWHGLEGLISERNQPCGGAGATLKAGLLRFDPTAPLAQKWTVVQDTGDDPRLDQPQPVRGLRPGHGFDL